jgi:hypothetical protein
MEQGFQRLGIAIDGWSLWTTDSPVSNCAAHQEEDRSYGQQHPDPPPHREAFKKIETAVQTSAGSNVAIANGDETTTAPVKLQ